MASSSDGGESRARQGNQGEPKWDVLAFEPKEGIIVVVAHVEVYFVGQGSDFRHRPRPLRCFCLIVFVRLLMPLPIVLSDIRATYYFYDGHPPMLCPVICSVTAF